MIMQTTNITVSEFLIAHF